MSLTVGIQRTADVARLVQDPTWLPHRYDPEYDAVHFLNVDRKLHAEVSFLADTDLPASLNKVVLTREECAAPAKSSAAQVHFIFHSAYCCSTLLARAFDLPGVSMGLKEPQILNDIVGYRQRGADQKQLTNVLRDTLNLLAQPFSLGEHVVIKPSNVVNAVADTILEHRQDSRGLLLYAPLPHYLGSIARKGMWGAVWVRKHFIGALKDGIVDLGYTQEQLLGQTDLQIAAIGWLTQHALFAKLIERFGDRVRSLNAESLLQHKSRSVLALAELFGLPISAGYADDIAAGTAFTRHSKTSMTFGSSDRARDQRKAQNIYRDEIEKVTIWAETVASRAGIPMTLGSRLL